MKPTPLATAILLAALASPMAHAQQRLPVQRQIARLPANKLPIIVKPIVPQVEVELVDLPLSLVEEDDPIPARNDPKAVWTITRRAPKVGSAGAIGIPIPSAMYVKRSGFFPPYTRQYNGRPVLDTCPSLQAWIDLSSVRQNGFTITRARLDPVWPKGMKLDSPPAFHFGNDRDHMGYTPEISSIMVVYYPVSEFTMPHAVPKAGSLCHSEFYLHIWVKGPKGLNPYTGRPYPTQQIN